MRFLSSLGSAAIALLAVSACDSPSSPTAEPAEVTDKGRDAKASDADATMAAADKPASGDVVVPATTFAAFGSLPVSWDKEGSNDALRDLGRTLYFDKRLSKNHDVSCNSCHALARFGVDNEATSPGHKGQLGGRNSPTVYNAAGHLAQFWDGRAADVEAQAVGPILNPVEMAMPNEAAVLEVINSIPGYADMFAKAFPGAKAPVTYDNVGAAIGAFERRLVTPNSKYDAFAAGKKDALTSQQKRGLNTFMASGCITCHSGALFGGLLYQKLGLVRPWPDASDLGRGGETKNAAENFFFKVPSLRNIEKTGPYFHDGKVATLSDAVKLMASHQLGKDLKPTEVDDITAFLKSLTGTPDAAYIKEPALPKSGPKTPKPDPS